MMSTSTRAKMMEETRVATTMEEVVEAIINCSIEEIYLSDSSTSGKPCSLGFRHS